MSRAALAFLVLTAGCRFGIADIPQVPDNPTWENDVTFIMEDHCVLCHGSPAARGAPGHFRLDVYDDVGGAMGAKTMAGSIVMETMKDSMPPSAAWGDGLGPNAKATLKKWFDNDAPK